MAVEERVVIHVDIDSDIEDDLRGIEARIKAMEDRFDGADKKMSKLDRTVDKTTRKFNKFGSVVTGVAKGFQRFFNILTKFSFVGWAVTIGVASTALLGMKAALATGRIAAQGYTLALKGLSVAAAATASAIAVVAASVRQYSEAMLMPQLSGQAGGSSQFLRTISRQITGLIGREDTTALASGLGQIGLNANQANSALTNLFNLSGGNVEGISSILQALRTQNRGDAVSEELLGALGGIGPQGAGIAEKAGEMTGQEFIDGLISGALTPEAYQGFADQLSTTMLGTLKIEFAAFFDLFANIGEPMIEPFRQAFQEISLIVQDSMLRMAPLINDFGADSFAPTLVTAVEKTTKFIEDNITRYLPDVEQMGKSFVRFFGDVRDFFVEIGEAMKPFEEAGGVLWEFLKAIGGGFGGNNVLDNLNNALVRNAENFERLGVSIGGLIGSLISAFGDTFDRVGDNSEAWASFFDTLASDLIPAAADLVAGINAMLVAALPVIERFIEVVAPILSGLGSILGGVAGTGGGVGNIAGAAFTAWMFAGGRRGRGISRAFGRGGRGASAGAGLLSRARNPFAFNAGGSLLGHATPGAGGKAAQVAGRFGKFGKIAKPLPVLGTALSGLDAYNQIESGNVGGGALSGAFAGAGIGAGIGSLFPVIGTGIGAAVGAVIGGLGAGIAAHFKKNEIKKEVKQTGVDTAEQYTSLLLDGAGNSFESLSSKATELRSVSGMTDDEFKTYVRRNFNVNTDDLDHFGSFREGFESDLDTQIAELEFGAERIVSGINVLADALDEAPEDIQRWLDNSGFDISQGIGPQVLADIWSQGFGETGTAADLGLSEILGGTDTFITQRNDELLASANAALSAFQANGSNMSPDELLRNVQAMQIADMEVFGLSQLDSFDNVILNLSKIEGMEGFASELREGVIAGFDQHGILPSLFEEGGPFAGMNIEDLHLEDLANAVDTAASTIEARVQGRANELSIASGEIEAPGGQGALSYFSSNNVPGRPGMSNEEASLTFLDELETGIPAAVEAGVGGIEIPINVEGPTISPTMIAPMTNVLSPGGLEMLQRHLRTFVTDIANQAASEHATTFREEVDSATDGDSGGGGRSGRQNLRP